MLSKREFYVLRTLFENGGRDMTQRVLAERVRCSLGTANAVVARLRQAGFIDGDYALTESGMRELEPYRVQNALILAAGMSTRFAPISYERPKGLISVKGEVLVERLIRQLHEAGIDEIVVVVGYMMEKFLYLREKYGVKFVVNNEYATKNTHSSVYAARDHLGNTYILCSDNYYPHNMLHRYEYHAFYCSVYMPGVSYVERALISDRKGLIVDTDKPSKDQWVMYGHAYFDRRFTERFKPLLESYYGRPGVEYMYWETIYAENVKQLPMYIEKCTPDQILEFDSIEELKAFDSGFIANNSIKIFENICNALGCRLADITDIVPLNKGLNNHSFKFVVGDESYIYRHPGVNANSVIDRRKEAASLRAAKALGVDRTLICINEEYGWKISRFVETTEEFDFSDPAHIKMLAAHLKTLHGANIDIGFGFDYRQEADRLIDKEKYLDVTLYRQMLDVLEMMGPVFRLLESDPWQYSFCHNDLYAPNLLVSGDRLEIIDWEFAGNADIGFDICKLFSLNQPKYEDIDQWLFPYYGRETTDAEKLHLLACSCVIYYYWYIWGMYVSKNGEQAAGYLMGWYEKMLYYHSEIEKRL